MSERELRDFAKDTAGYYAPDGVRDLCRDLLADEPDVVKVLRWLEDEYRANLIPFDDLSIGRGNAYAGTIKVIEQQFRVRLTNGGGWEWVE